MVLGVPDGGWMGIVDWSTRDSRRALHIALFKAPKAYEGSFYAWQEPVIGYWRQQHWNLGPLVNQSGWLQWQAG